MKTWEETHGKKNAVCRDGMGLYYYLDPGRERKRKEREEKKRYRPLLIARIASM